MKERRLRAKQSESEAKQGDESIKQTTIDSDDVFENSKEKALTPPGGPTSNHQTSNHTTASSISDPWPPTNTTTSNNDPWTPKPPPTLNGDPWSLR